MIHIKYNTAGKFVPGAFYDLDVPLSMGIYEDVPDERSGVIVSGKTGVEYFRAEIIHHYEPVRRCSAKQAHVLEWRTKEISTDLFGSVVDDEIGVLLPDISGSAIAMRSDFADRFTQQDFRGAKTQVLSITVNQSNLRNPRFNYLQIQGRHCMREPEVIVDGSITCPYCGWEPMICPACKYWERNCPSCQKNPYVESDKHEGASDVRFKRDKPPNILDGRRWNGSDFMEAWTFIVSERVVHWLQATHAYPFIAKPLRFDITGMTRDQIRMLKEVAPKAANAL